MSDTIPTLVGVTAPGSRVNVALTGTSNCILMNGIAYGIKAHPGVDAFLNKSIGASGAVAIAAHLKDFDLSGYHYVFIDYCINESIFLSQGVEQMGNTYRHIAAIIDHAARAGCVPVVINLPSMRSLGHPIPMLEMIQHEFVARGVGVFDAQHLLETWAQERGVEIQQCFLDKMHLKRAIAYAMGEILVNIMSRVHDAQAIASVAHKTDARYGAVEFVSAPELISETDYIHRENRHLATTLLPLAPGQQIEIPAPDRGSRAIRGVAYNAARSIGSLILEQERTLVDIGRSIHFGAKRDLSMAIIPSGVPDMPFSEGLRLSYPGAAALSDDPCPIAFELAGLVLHDLEETRPLHGISIAADSRQLHHTLEASDWAILDAAWAAARDS